MNTTFLLTGGAGRIIAAIPALENYYENNPKDDFKVLIYGWDNLYHSHPILQNRTYSADQKGVFDLIVKNSNLIVPEPYHVYEYYNNRMSIAEAFDVIINKENASYKTPKLYLHPNENRIASKMVNEAKDKYNKENFIVFQPYGSGMREVNGEWIDSSNRSLDINAANYIASELSKKAAILYFGPLELVQSKSESFLLTAKDVPNADLRFFMAMIKNSDYFVGVDSVGQHMARSFSIPGTVLMGSTFEENVSYVDWFNFYRKEDFKPYYNPIRISQTDSDFSDRLNISIMDFSKMECDNIVKSIFNSMNLND